MKNIVPDYGAPGSNEAVAEGLLRADQITRTASRKLLVVERKLASFRGHHHTQLASIARLFAEHEMHLVAGEDYDGFLGDSVARITRLEIAASRHRWRMKHGTVKQQLSSFVRMLPAGNILKMPKSPYGSVLMMASQALQMSKQDCIVIPSADLLALESVAHFLSVAGANTPHFIVRILSSDLGEHNETRRRKRLGVLRNVLSSQAPLELHCETWEQAMHLQENYGLNVRGGFYLPCNFDPRDPPQHKRPDDGVFRIGLFGGPRPGKGYEHVEDIIACLQARLRTKPSGKKIEVLLQGAESDYAPGGVFGFVSAPSPNSDQLIISRHPVGLPTEQFETLFLSADAVLLPFDAAIYGLQGSGVVQDAIATEKTIFHTPGISMQDLLSEEHSICACDPADFADAIIKEANSGVERLPALNQARRSYGRLLDEFAECLHARVERSGSRLVAA